MSKGTGGFRGLWQLYAQAFVSRELHTLLEVLVRDLRRFPLPLVRRVVDLLGCPFALNKSGQASGACNLAGRVWRARLEIWVVNEGRLPLAIILVVPILGLGRVRVGNLCSGSAGALSLDTNKRQCGGPLTWAGMSS